MKFAALATPMRFWITLLLLAAVPLTAVPLAAQTAKPDALGRENPRSAVTGFLEACQDRDYARAAQYLDLRAIPQAKRAERGPDLAKRLDAALNSDPYFSVFRLSQDAQGNVANDPEPGREHTATVKEGPKSFTLDLARVTPSPGATPVWLFASDTVLELPKLTLSPTSTAIARWLPPFFSNIQILDTPLWKWLALLVTTLLLVIVSRLFDRAINAVFCAIAGRFHLANHVAWAQAVLGPIRVLVCLLLFRVGLEFVAPSALARLYIGRIAQAIFVWSVAWALMRIVGLLLLHVENRMDENRRSASRSVLHLGRRTINASIGILAVLLVLSNWGYNTATLVAGLGVGGIAIALAAQQTIANIFGGVSVIADHPIRIGEYGKFGDLSGTLEDIGLRSTRIRTLNRTVVSVPNSTFAGYNLENYGSRDKLLFNPTLAVKRGAEHGQITAFIETLSKMLASRKDLEPPPTPVRIVGLSGAAINIEIFCYVATRDTNRFYTIEGELYLAVDQALAEAKLELA